MPVVSFLKLMCNDIFCLFLQYEDVLSLGWKQIDSGKVFIDNTSKNINWLSYCSEMDIMAVVYASAHSIVWFNFDVVKKNKVKSI